MATLKFHKIAALIVTAGFAIWTLTGTFSSVGSAAKDPAKADQSKAPGKPDNASIDAALRTVAVITPPRLNYARAVRMSGLTEADKRAILTTRNAGLIGKLPVKQGDVVKSGDLILQLAAEDKVAAVDTARALLSQREAETEAAQQLAKSGNLARLSLENSRSILALARSQLETAQAALDRDEIRAPFDGIVDRLDVEQGSSVAQGAAVATLLSLDPVLATGEVSERELKYLSVGDKAEVRLISGQHVEGEIRYISRDASAQTRTFRLEVAIPNKDSSIPAGMSSEITLKVAPEEAVMLPRSVITLSADGELGIRLVDAQDIVSFHAIDLLDDTPNGVVLAGVPQGARIIVAGQDLVTDGDKVNIVEADPAMIRKLVSTLADG